MIGRWWIQLGAGLLLGGYSLTAAAISIGFQPDHDVFGLGDTFNIDIVVSDLTADDEIVAGYDLDVGYDASILNAEGVSFGPYLDDPLFPVFTFSSSDFSEAGVVDFAELSLLSDNELAAQQPDAFTLATLTFSAVGTGSTALTFLPDPLFGFEVTGRNAQILDVDAGTARLTVVPPPVAVTEPGFIFFLFAVLALWTMRRMKLDPKQRWQQQVASSLDYHR